MQSNWIPLTSMPEVRSGHGSCIWNNFVYVAGGATLLAAPLTPVGTVKFAKLNAVNKLGDWLVAGPDVVARTGCAMMAANGYMYVMGGDDGGVAPVWFSDIQCGLIQQNGTINAWKQYSLPDAMSQFGSFVHNNVLYIMGGTNAAGLVQQCWKANLNGDGSLNMWVPCGLLPVAANLQNAVVCEGGFVYAYIGAVIWVFKLEASGQLVFVRSLDSTFTRTNLNLVSMGDTLAVIGGDDGGVTQSSVMLVRVTPNGTLGSRYYAGPSLTVPRESAAVAIPPHGTQLVVSGGNDGTDALASVEENEMNRFVGETDIQKSTV